MPGPNPHDCDAEDALVGEMLAWPNVITDVAAQVVPDDFYQPTAGAAFAALVQAWNEGNPLGTTALAAVLREAGLDVDPAWIVRTQQVSDGSWRVHARTVVAHRLRRQVLSMTTSALNDIQDPAIDPTKVVDQLRASLEHLHVPDGSPPKDLTSLDEFLDQPEHAQASWLIPGLLRRGWRVVIVGGEGRGKSVLVRQLAMLAAQGIHPLGFERGTPLRTLLVDLENPPDAIVQTCVPIRGQVQRSYDYEPGRAWLWHRPQGINLRTRAHQAELGAVVAATQPDVVLLGPLYKAYSRDSRETDEQATADVQRVFDDLRTRFGFALVLEHHAPQDNAGFRTMRPYGSSLWLRWPEIGLGMEKDPDNHGSIKLTRWRGDRMKSMWPDRIDRGQVWPWTGHWDHDWRIEP